MTVKETLASILRLQQLNSPVIDETINRQVNPEYPFDEDQSSKGDYTPVPLLLATERGIAEIGNRLLERAEEVTLFHYAMLRNKENKTCEELFKTKHNERLKRAQQWRKDTPHSCTAVAVLVAIVTFSAAYTVPGGSNEKGFPVFLNNTLFLVFTVMEAIALTCSLTSIVMFLFFLT
ncbi:uncharacterized protein LOC123221465 [Mangifera indica]|uniref:uncharacterized protein LOC123221465 n=1 Tax=Mangifera indica TaxID=29780 RepID=UPI001CFB527A|nr:uncharacterized protein LOC123221465 [Mangifera indica]